MRFALLMMLLLGMPPGALCGGPRWMTGPPFYTGQQGVPVVWGTNNLLYSTDPGGLSGAVNHQAADALVAAAAGVWNLPLARITLSRGGSLAEHVSSGNTYLGTSGMVFPADVQSTNSAAVPIAVIYDTDGSVTDLLLGGGASSPGSCAQNGVTESVDQFDPAGYIVHAIIVVNGRCTGSAPEKQMQLQYQLMRGFGRVLGLAWSQCNDNVFTGTPTPTYNQAMNWPIMHPLDIICGPYAYQCLPSPFQLRPDDVSAMVFLYPNGGGGPFPAGKQASLQGGAGATGNVWFPTGEGMAGVNVLLQREDPNTLTLDPWVEASGVSGVFWRRDDRSPFVPAPSGGAGAQGTYDQNVIGRYWIGYVPFPAGSTVQTYVMSAEAVNPLYAGAHGVGPYQAGTVAPSGSMPPGVAVPGVTPGGIAGQDLLIGDAAPQCSTGLDGMPDAPVQMPATGWWNGLICGYGHASYLSLDVRPGRSLTVEVTALDEQGLPTTGKLMPAMGLYAPTDGGGSLPSIAAAPTAFQALGLGTTTMPALTGQLMQVKLGIADQRGDGRPDFAFQARMFYADSLLPERLPPAGGTVTISGMGFRIGNQVRVNGVLASVTSWSSNQVVAVLPTMAAAGASNKIAVDVSVNDLSTGANSTLSGAFMYDSDATLPNNMKLVSAEEASTYVGTAAAVPFAVQVVKADGVTPVAGEQVVFTVAAGSAQYAACGAASCTVLTDANGMASTGVTPTAAGVVTLQAADGPLTESADFRAVAADGSMVVVSAPSGSVPNGVGIGVPFSVQILGPGGSRGPSGRLVTFTATNGSASFYPCSSSTCGEMTDWSGTARAWVTPTAIGPVTLQASDGALQQSVTFQSLNNVDLLQVTGAPAPTLPVRLNAGFTVRLMRADGVTPDSYQTVMFSTSAPGVLYPCQVSSCARTTGPDGTANVNIHSAQAGSYTVQAAFGTVTQTISVTFTDAGPHLVVVSQPSAVQAVGAFTDRPLTLQLVTDDGTPMPGQLVPLSGLGDQVVFGASGGASCYLLTDGNGMISSPVMALRAGTVLLTADFASSHLSLTFTAVAPADVLSLVSGPGAGTFTGDPESFVVQVLQPDGVTPAVGRTILFSVASGLFSFNGCSALPCAVVTGANGRATISGSASAAGTVTVLATDGSASLPISFQTTARPDVLRLLSGPSGNTAVGDTAPVPFAVQVFQPDGVTPAVGRSLTFAVSAGSVRFSTCPTAPCTLVSDGNGRASATVIPLLPGGTTVLAAEGALSVSASFTATAAADTMRLVSAPSGNVTVHSAAGTNFSVQVLQSDGVTPSVGKTVVFSATSGSVQFAVCGAATCPVTTGSDGLASTGVTPLGAGAIGVVATDGPLTQRASFTAVAQPDTMRLVSAPGSNGMAGSVEGSAFSVQVLLADGVTPGAGRPVVLSVTAGSASYGACSGSRSCSLATDANGLVSSPVTPLGAGSVTLLASEGGVTQTATFTVVARPDTMRLVSSPAGNVTVGSAAAANFSVEVLQGDGVTPSAGKTVVFSASGGAVQFGVCGGGTCPVTTGSDGLASTTVTPLGAGPITVAATDGSLVELASFTGVARPDTMRVVSAPASGALVGNSASVGFAVAMVQGDGVTPDAGKQVNFSTFAGSARFDACNSATCVLTTDAHGMASTNVTPLAAGSVGLMAASGTISQTETFSAVNQVDVLRVVSAPGASLYVGATAATPFSVRLLRQDGTTPVAGAAIAFSASGTGAVQFLACAGTVCSVATDANGLASTSVVGGVAGAVTVTASAAPATGAQSVSTAVQVNANQESLLPGNPDTYVAEGSRLPANLAATATLNGAPGAGQAVTWTSAGALQLASVLSTTDSLGRARMPATAGPLTSGGTASASACAWTSVCATFRVHGVSAASLALQVVGGGAQVISSGATPALVSALVSDASGNPVAGATVNVSQTVSAVAAPCPAQGRCPAAQILASGSSVAVSDGSGLVSVAPMTMSGVATETKLALSAGTQGAATADVICQP